MGIAGILVLRAQRVQYSPVNTGWSYKYMIDLKHMSRYIVQDAIVPVPQLFKTLTNGLFVLSSIRFKSSITCMLPIYSLETLIMWQYGCATSKTG